MKKERMHACIWLSLIAFAVLALIAVIKAFTENPFRIELFLGTIGRFMGSFLCAVFIPVGVLNFVFAFFFPNAPLGVSAGIMCAWLYFGGVICANVMYHWLGKKYPAPPVDRTQKQFVDAHMHGDIIANEGILL